MQDFHNRRRFLAGIAAAGAAGLMAAPASSRAEAPPETNVIRLPAALGSCVAPLYVAEELLYAEGFTEVRYVPAAYTASPRLLADGLVDFDLEDGFDYLPVIDAGKHLMLLSGVHVGCFELRSHDSIRSVTELRGKKVGITARGGAEHLFTAAIAAYVGLNPTTEINWVTDPAASQADLFARGDIDAFVGFPPNPGQPCERTLGHTLVNMARDPPWSRYFCCMVAANADFVRQHPAATKRALRALLKATDICDQEPERAARRMAERGFHYECALMTLNDARYGLWREYDPADAVRFFTLRLHEAGMIKLTPNEVIAGYTDWRFLNELKREMKT